MRWIVCRKAAGGVNTIGAADSQQFTRFGGQQQCNSDGSPLAQTSPTVCGHQVTLWFWRKRHLANGNLTPVPVWIFYRHGHSIAVAIYINNYEGWYYGDGQQTMAVDDDGNCGNGAMNRMGCWPDFHAGINQPIFCHNTSCDTHTLDRRVHSKVSVGQAVPDGWTNMGMPMPVVALPTVYRVPDSTMEGTDIRQRQSVCGNSGLRLVLKRDGPSGHGATASMPGGSWIRINPCH